MNKSDFIKQIILIEKEDKKIMLDNIIINKKINKFNRIFIYSSLYEKFILKNNKEKAAFYTNFDIAFEMVKLSLKNFSKKELSNKKILDPAVWTGIFIFALIKYLEEELDFNKKELNEFIIKNINIQDIDKESIDFFLFLLENVLNIKNFKNIIIDSFFNNKNKYDIIIWNPPYWLSLKKEKEIIKNHYKLQQKEELSNDSYGLFFLHAFNLLNEKWIIVFITPNSFMNIKNFYWLRKILIDYIDEIILLNKNVFKNKITNLQPWIETVITKIKKEKTNNLKIVNNLEINYLRSKDYSIDYSKKNIRILNKKNLKKIYNIPLSFFLTDELIDILIDNKFKKVKDYFDSAMWIKTANNNLFLNKKKTKQYKDKFIKGTSKEKQEYKCDIYDYIDFENFINNRPKNSNLPQDKFLDKDIFKIWIPEIWHKWLMTAFKYKDEYVSNSIWIYRLKEEFYSEKQIEFFVNLLNQPIYKEITKVFSNNIRLEKHVIDNLPIIK